MPAKIELQELSTVTIGNVAVTLAAARGKRAVLYVAASDEDGLIEGPEETLAAAARYLSRYPKRRPGGGGGE